MNASAGGIRILPLSCYVILPLQTTSNIAEKEEATKRRKTTSSSVMKKRTTKKRVQAHAACCQGPGSATADWW
jgi:hypothetical protein